MVYYLPYNLYLNHFLLSTSKDYMVCYLTLYLFKTLLRNTTE